eukprot:6205377-Pleurochrysis_carterae.AAC.1
MIVQTIHHPAWRGRGDNAELLRMAMWKEGDYTVCATPFLTQAHTAHVGLFIDGRLCESSFFSDVALQLLQQCHRY